jgi:predicted O-linked N-acetylglucosamine transferase (SPINDLY family)
MLHLDENRRLDATAALERAAACAPDDGLIAAHLLFQKMHLCRWDGIDELASRVRAAVEADTADIPPFILLSTPGTTPALQRRASENHSARMGIGENRNATRRNAGASRLRVGYLSSDFKNHATVLLMIDMLEAHDRSRFEIFALSHGIDDASPLRARVAAAVEHFVELAGLPEREAVSSIAALELDVLIDLKGYTEGNHSEWLRHRLAPVQINWLGYPGTLGAPWTDYLIADEIVAPKAHRWMFSERLLYLPCYQPNCRERECAPIPERAAEGLPEDALVLCSFNQTYKITPGMFGLWLDVLRAVPETVLWLWASNPWAEDALRQVAQEGGVAPERLVFAEGQPQAEHLARLSLADLALDTFPCNGHTTTSDALWAGVPVVTLQGEAFAARVAASLLTAAGLEELIADAPKVYLERVIRFCRDAGWRGRLREKTEALRESSGLFDGAAFARGFETLLSGVFTDSSESGEQKL